MRRIERRIGGCRLVLEHDGNGTWTACLDGEVDRFDARDLSYVLASVLRSPHTVVHLDGVSFLDLAAARSLRALVGSAGGVRVVASPGTPCARLLAWLSAHEHA